MLNIDNEFSDVVPVVYARWEFLRQCPDAYGTTMATCSACKKNQRLGDYLEYCPYCGAKMRR